MFRKIHKRMKGEKGFTLIELLVVIIIIAILAAIAIPTFLGQRSKAQDASAKSLVRNAMTSIESAFVDTQTYVPGTMTADILGGIEPSITFAPVLAAAAPTASTCPAATSTTALHAVDYFGTASTYSVATKSASGNTFGVAVNKATGTIFVKSIGGTFSAGW